MSLAWDEHPDEELLEAYATGSVDEAERVAVEKHLLICDSCCCRLQELEQFLAALDSVVLRPATAPGSIRVRPAARRGST